MENLSGQSRAAMRQEKSHIFTAWTAAARRLHNAAHIALFLDFDGTLTPLRQRPEEVVLGQDTRDVLTRLAKGARVTLWVISGRRLADLQRRVDAPNVRCAGLHGWERSGNKSQSFGSMKALRQARKLLAENLRGLRKIWIEDKSRAVAVHYRRAPIGVVRQGSAV